MTKAVLKNRIFINVAQCDQCGTCVAVCPSNALKLTSEALIVADAQCRRCSHCVRICPVGALTLLEASNVVKGANHG